MENVTIRLTDQREWENLQPFLFASQQPLLRKKGVLLAACCGDTLCGALGAVMEDNVFSILSLFVEESFRRQGAALELLKTAADTARGMGAGGLSAAYCCEAQQAEAIHRLFLRAGFALPERGNMLLSLPVSSLGASYFAALPEPSPEMAKHIVPLRSLSAKAQEDYRRRLGRDIPAYMDSRNIPGTLLPGLCFAYVEGQRICSMPLVSAANGCLHIGGAYVQQAGYGRALIGLLKTALRIAGEEYSQYDTLTVTAATEAGRQLMERLLAGADIRYYTSYLAGMAILPEDGPRPAGFYGVMARFNTMAEELAERRVASSLVVENGAMPHLELKIDGAPEHAELHYEAHGGESYEGFRLGAAVVLPGGQLDDGSRAEVCEKVSAAGPASAWTPEQLKGKILLHGELEEPPYFDTAAVIDQFVMPYIAQAELCAKLTARNP